MAFLDNSGDIILDAVLTDHGRKQLAQGDGSFQITKFSLADDEIDYGLYNKNHLSGTAYFDLEILQTPILEAFTDNAASMKYNLVSYSNLEFLFLPVLLLNQADSNNQMSSDNTWYCAVNAETENNNNSTTTFTAVATNPGTGGARTGWLLGGTMAGSNWIRIDEGLNTTSISPAQALDSMLREDIYIISMDSRLGELMSVNGNPAPLDYIDDDKIGYYTIAGGNFVRPINDPTTNANQVIAGPRGTSVGFKIQASMDLSTSPYLFQQLGGTTTLLDRAAGAVATYSTVLYIDSTIKVTGTKTGVTINVPIRYVRLA